MIAYLKRTLPVLRSGDVVIAGGSFAGIAAALTFSRSGKKVVLVEPRTYLGREISAVLSPWISTGRLPKEGFLAEMVHEAQKDSQDQEHDEIPLHIDSVKRFIEDRLMEAGIEILYASQPVGLGWENEALTGLIVGNKSGRQVIAGKVVVDATETALVARLAGFPLSASKAVDWGRNVEFDSLGAFTPGPFSMPPELGLVGNQVYLHKGYRKGHGVVEGIFNLPDGKPELEGMSWREMETRERCMRLAAWLKQNHPAFEKAYLGNVSYELKGRYTGHLESSHTEWTGSIKNRESLEAYATPCPAIWMLNGAARLDDTAFDDPITSFAMGEKLAHGLVEAWKKILTARALWKPSIDEQAPTEIEVHEPESPQRGRKYPRQSVPGSQIPILAEVDVLVVGGGTSGAIAAYAASSEKASTFVVEMLPGLGGTGTYGGVHSYWCGYRGGFVTKVRRWVNQSQKELGLSGLKGYIPVWNMDSKAYALEKQLRKQGVRFLYNAKVIGALVEGNVVRGIIAATRLGPVAILGKITVDASGDGDVAAFAGAEFVFGSPRDHSVMWFSLPQFFKPGRNRNNFSSPVDISNIEDFNRALLSGRRRGKVGDDHDHGIYLATRESRHIVGDVCQP